MRTVGANQNVGKQHDIRAPQTLLRVGDAMNWINGNFSIAEQVMSKNRTACVLKKQITRIQAEERVQGAACPRHTIRIAIQQFHFSSHKVSGKKMWGRRTDGDRIGGQITSPALKNSPLTIRANDRLE